MSLSLVVGRDTNHGEHSAGVPTGAFEFLNLMTLSLRLVCRKLGNFIFTHLRVKMQARGKPVK